MAEKSIQQQINERDEDVAYSREINDKTTVTLCVERPIQAGDLLYVIGCGYHGHDRITRDVTLVHHDEQIAHKKRWRFRFVNPFLIYRETVRVMVKTPRK